MHNVRFLDIKSQVVIMGLRIMPSLSFAFLSAKSLQIIITFIN